MSYQLITKLQKKAIPVKQSCRVLAVSRAAYYYAQSRAAKPVLCQASMHLKAAFNASGQSYGSRRLVSALAAQGIEMGRYKARRLMRQAGLKPVWKRKFIHTPDSRHTLPIADNILARQFNPSAPNTAFVTDITYTRPIADRFPDMDRCIGIANSFRFDASIAALAAPFAHAPVMPAGLKGVRATDASGHGLPHTIFVFPDDDASMVLDAFGRHVLACAPPALIGTSAIAAIGAVHKPFEDVLPGHRHYPKTVPHYWAGYQPHAGKQAYHPRTLVEYFHSARAIARNGGPVHQAIDGVAFGVIHLANLLAGVAHVKAPARRHLHIEQQLRDDSEVRAIYRDAVTRFLIDRETLTRDQWVVLCPRLKMLFTRQLSIDHAAYLILGSLK